MRWAGHVERIGGKRNTYIFWFWKHE